MSKGKKDFVGVKNMSELMSDNTTVKVAPKNSKKVLAKIFGFELLSDTVYTVRDRPDLSAPDAYVREGVSKCPSIPDNGSRNVCRFDQVKKIFDTGLYASSFSLLEFSEAEKSIEIERRRESIFEPVASLINSDLKESNFEFWDKYDIEIGKEVAFVTSDPIDAFKLYIALTSGLLSPFKEFHHSYKFAMYYVEGASGKYDFKSESDSRMVDAISEFAIMLREDKSRVLDILFQLRVINASESLDDSFLKPVVKNWINDNPSNSSYLLSEISKVSNNQIYADSLKIARMIETLVYRNKLVRDMDGVKLDGVVIGQDALSAAEFILSEAGGAERLKAIVERYDLVMKNDSL